MNEPGYIKTACRACGQHIEAPVQLAGETVPCPNCAEPVTIPDAPPPPSPTRTQRITMPPPPAHRPAPAPRRAPATMPPPPSRPAPGLPVSAIPPTNTTDAYLVPVLIIFAGIAIGILAGTGTIDSTGPIVVLFSLLAPLLVFCLVLGHIGAIAARLKTIEDLLRAPRH